VWLIDISPRIGHLLKTWCFCDPWTLARLHRTDIRRNPDDRKRYNWNDLTTCLRIPCRFLDSIKQRKCDSKGDSAEAQGARCSMLQTKHVLTLTEKRRERHAADRVIENRGDPRREIANGIRIPAQNREQNRLSGNKNRPVPDNLRYLRSGKGISASASSSLTSSHSETRNQNRTVCVILRVTLLRWNIKRRSSDCAINCEMCARLRQTQ